MTRLPPLDPAVAATRVALRRALREPNGPTPTNALTGSPEAHAAHPGGAAHTLQDSSAPLLLVALSGGADSLALAAAAGFEAPKSGWRAGAVIVDHGLQAGSAEVAEVAAAQARQLGLEPVLVCRVEVPSGAGSAAGNSVAGNAGAGEYAGPEAAARDARYAALALARAETGAAVIVTAHTRDDQAEQVLLGLARGAGARSLAGIPNRRGDIVRPFLSITREQTLAACAAQDLTPWHDPHNRDPRYTRVRVRETVLPLLETELGPGIAAALARTAEQAREDAEAFDTMVDEQIEEIVEPAEAGIAVSVLALAANPAAVRHRIIRRVAEAEFGSDLTREQTLRIAALVTAWSGQGPVYVPGIQVARVRDRIVYTQQIGSPRL